MKVIFLDFDGVVACLPQQWDHLPSGRRVHALSRPAVARLNDLVARTGAVVVVTSTWRLHHPVQHLRSYLVRAGFEGQVLSITPDHRNATTRLRGNEIAEWLGMHPQADAYVVLDDDDDRGPIPAYRWVIVKGGWLLGGLQQVHVELAVVALGLPVGEEVVG